MRDLTDHAKQTGHSRKNTADADELETMRQRTAEQQRAATLDRTAEQERRLALRGLGVRVRDGLVYYAGTLTEGHLLGELKGAEAEITDATKPQMIRAGLTSGIALGTLIGPLALLPGVFRKSKAVAFVVFANGTVHERKLDGNAAIRAAQRDVVKFNALVERPSPQRSRNPQQLPGSPLTGWPR